MSSTVTTNTPTKNDANAKNNNARNYTFDLTEMLEQQYANSFKTARNHHAANSVMLGMPSNTNIKTK